MSFPLSLYGIFTLLITAALSGALAILGCKLLNKAPAKWFCDYGEQPDDALLHGTRFDIKRAGIPSAIALALCSACCIFAYGLTLFSVILILIMVVLLLIGLSDGRYTIIPDQLTVVLAVLCVCGAVCDLLGRQFFISTWWSPLAGGACGFILLYFINFLCRVLLKKDGFGFGDVKLFGALGLLLGFPCVFLVFLIAVFAAFFHIIFLFITKKTKNGSYMPMGPYICIGCTMLLILRAPVYTLIHMYLSLLGISF